MSERLRVVIVDDEEPARQRLLDLLAADAEVAVVGVCAGGREAIARIEESRPDLVLLDVQMPEVDGFAVIEAVGIERMPPLIFVTAFDEHARRAFEVRALDYLLKPFDRARFERVLAAAKLEIRAGRGQRFRDALGSLLRARAVEAMDRVLVPDGDEDLVVRTADIRWIEAAGNNLVLHLVPPRPSEPATHVVRSTLAALEARLDPRAFLRIHRDTIVHVDRVRRVQHWGRGQRRIVLDDETVRPVGRTYLARVEERFGRLNRAGPTTPRSTGD
jgi:two-component system, LytTR family, response regulator